MTAASLSRGEARGFDRLALTAGLALVAWSRRRAERHSRARVAAPRPARFTAAERADRMYDPYAPANVRTHGQPPTRLR